MAVTVRQDNVQAFLKAIHGLLGEEVVVGIPAAATRTGGMSNALLGYVHEYGSPARNIPARPFLVPGLKSAHEKIEQVLRKGADGALRGDGNAASKALHGAGLVAQSAVKQYIIDGHFVPLAPSTIAARKRRGFGSDKPLVVTASMLNSVTYVVRPKK